MGLRWRFTLFVIYVAFATPAAGQANDLYFENFTTDNGLAQNSGYSISQTPDGFMWFATQNGLDRFDGYHIKHYTRNDSIPYSLPENQIFRLLTDNDGRLWVSTRNSGIRVYDPRRDKFYRPSFLFGTDSSADNIFGKEMVKDHHGIVWIMTSSKGLYAFDPAKRSVQRMLNHGEADINLTFLTLNAGGEACATDGAEIYVFNGRAFLPFGLREKTGIGKEALPFHQFYFYNGEIWLTGDGAGIFRIDEKTGKLIGHISGASPEWPKGFSDVVRLFRDSKNKLWVASSTAGIFQYDGQTHQIKNGRSVAGDGSTLRNNYITWTFEDSHGTIWAGLNGGGIARNIAVKSFFRHDPITPVSVDEAAAMLYSANDRDLFIGTWSGGMIKAEDDFHTLHAYSEAGANQLAIAGNEVRYFANDGAGNLWIATDEGLCKTEINGSAQTFTRYPGNLQFPGAKYLCSVIKLRYKNALLVSGNLGMLFFDLDKNEWQHIPDPQNFTGFRTITAFAMLEDSSYSHVEKGIVWLGTEKFGLVAYNYLSGKFSEYKNVTVISKTIRHILLQQNILWLASDNGLLACSTEPNSRPRRFTDEEGLPGGVAYAMLPDDKGNLWVSTNSGISRFNKATETFTSFPAGPGPKGTEFNTGACLKMRGRMFFGAINGVYSFDPAMAPADNFSADVLITGIDVMNAPFKDSGNISFTKKISLGYRKNFLGFHFAAPNYFAPEKTTYSCMLEDVDKDWVNIGTENFKDYTDLAPGKYFFKVRAANSAGVWCKNITVIEINIAPPWWLTWWFKLLLAAAGVCCLYLFYRIRVRKVKRSAMISQRLSEYELKALHSQMNPHFVFNCLGSIKQLIQSGEKENANRYLGKFAVLIRLSLEQSAQSFISLAQNNEYIKVYIEMEQLRFTVPFKYTLAVPGEYDATELQLPPMMIQPLIENAIWHGLRNTTAPGMLDIVFFTEGESLVCTVSDNGPGLAATQKNIGAHKSMGLDNIRRRLELINEKYRYTASLDINERPGGGVVATLKLPLIC